MNKLRFVLEPRPYPHLNEPGIHQEVWGRLTVRILLDDEVTTLLDTEWDLALLIEWYIENRTAICEEEFSLSINNRKLFPLVSESLARMLNRLQEQDFSEDQEDIEQLWFDSLYKFRQQHSLRFALRGSKVPAIIIGLNRNTGEISLSDVDKEWAYTFDMEEFCSNLCFWFKDFLFEHLSLIQGAATKTRIENLVKKLDEISSP